MAPEGTHLGTKDGGGNAGSLMGGREPGSVGKVGGEGNADNLMEGKEPGSMGEVGREAMAEGCRPEGNAGKNDGGREPGSTGNVGGNEGSAAMENSLMERSQRGRAEKISICCHQKI
jgi:hypothetical protein